MEIFLIFLRHKESSNSFDLLSNFVNMNVCSRTGLIHKTSSYPWFLLVHLYAHIRGDSVIMLSEKKVYIDATIQK